MNFSHMDYLAQTSLKEGNFLVEPGVIITITLLAIPVLVAIWLLVTKTFQGGRGQPRTDHDPQGSVGSASSGLIGNIDQEGTIRYLPRKQQAAGRPQIHPPLANLILWYLATATFWLLFGTTVGEYLGIKFVAPDVDHVSWLSFGRLRPVHTNAVFWGWASLAMVGLGYYVVPMVSNVRVTSIRIGWWTLGLINAAVLFGSIALMAGINNAGGEYREYIWPIMLLFAIGIVLTLGNFLSTIARRRTE